MHALENFNSKSSNFLKLFLRNMILMLFFCFWLNEDICQHYYQLFFKKVELKEKACYI